jgi:hypothetical protein
MFRTANSFPSGKPPAREITSLRAMMSRIKPVRC